MKTKKKILSGIGCLVICAILSSCGSKKSVISGINSTQVNNQLASVEQYKLITSKDRVSYTLPDPRKPKSKKSLKGLTLPEAREKVLQEAVIEHNCAIIVQPNYSYDTKGKKVKRITVVGYPATYDFPK